MLKIIQVGHDDASDRYIRNKIKAVEAAGMQAEVINLDDDSTTRDLVSAIEFVAGDKETSAIIVQLPLPRHIDKDIVLRQIPIEYDIDGLNPKSPYKPLTPCAIMRWLDESGVNVEGKNVAILGRSELVGKPLAEMMIERGATVSVMNSKTTQATKQIICGNADIIVSATGMIGAVSHSEVLFPRDGLIVIDVGINRNEEGKLCGDVSEGARRLLDTYGCVCTPVPGGVGKWTVRELVLRLAEMEGRNVEA